MSSGVPDEMVECKVRRDVGRTIESFNFNQVLLSFFVDRDDFLFDDIIANIEGDDIFFLHEEGRIFFIWSFYPDKGHKFADGFFDDRIRAKMVEYFIDMVMEHMILDYLHLVIEHTVVIIHFY